MGGALLRRSLPRYGMGGILISITDFFKNPKRKHLLPCILLALAAGFLLLFFPTGETEPKSTSLSPTEIYRAALEAEVESLLAEMDGVGDCRVVLTLSYGYEYTYATDQKVSQKGDGKETEKNLVLAGDNGNTSPILLREKQPVVSGAAVVCPGADNVTCLRIASLRSALFSIDSNQISIQT